jgi:tRNA (guanine-N7-)-methyltransferase
VQVIALDPAPDPETPTGLHIRTFHPRRGRIGTVRADALARLWPERGFTIDPAGPGFDAAALFGRRAPLVLEIGCGMGEATAAMAAADPGRDYLGADVHTPGLANLLAIAEREGLDNVRAARGDAVELLRDLMKPDALDAVHVFFPDPWPKAKHHKRRIIRPDAVALIRERLRPGGVLHCATDWAPYAEQMALVLAADPGLRNRHDGFAPRPGTRPVTKFERRALAAGRAVFDLVFERRPD